MPRDLERGETAMRVVIGVMALLAGLAWVVPMVFLGRQQVDRAADLTGASSRDREPVAAAPTDPIGMANDLSAQARLTSTMQAAQAHYAETGTYEGFDAEAAAADPSIQVGGRAATGQVSVRAVTATTIVLVTSEEGGGPLCAAADGDLVTYGRADAQTPLQCSGGW